MGRPRACTRSSRRPGRQATHDEPGVQRPRVHPGRPATPDEPGHRGLVVIAPQVTVLDAVKELASTCPSSPSTRRAGMPRAASRWTRSPVPAGHSPPDRPRARRDRAHRRPAGLDRGRGTDARLPRRDRRRRTAHPPADPRGLDGRLRPPRRAGNSPGSATSPRCSPPTTRWRSGCCTRSARPAWTSRGDVSVVGFDDIPEAAHFWPPLTTVHQDFAELGRRAVGLLLGELGADRDNIRTGLFPSWLSGTRPGPRPPSRTVFPVLGAPGVLSPHPRFRCAGAGSGATSGGASGVAWQQ